MLLLVDKEYHICSILWEMDALSQRIDLFWSEKPGFEFSIETIMPQNGRSTGQIRLSLDHCSY